ncbi:hypothetical protein DdX_06105 [Ditylenchus destructor]|uniref:Uncharacterized protein n=1 Tax=Ditylenchus destructor TaxID=166010 RepID=A0AAD4R6B3_9BILA|nr:hypothetical protein DdX_06105 [Ditylenchus destructor]
MYQYNHLEEPGTSNVEGVAPDQTEEERRKKQYDPYFYGNDLAPDFVDVGNALSHAISVTHHNRDANIGGKPDGDTNTAITSQPVESAKIDEVAGINGAVSSVDSNLSGDATGLSLGADGADAKTTDACCADWACCATSDEGNFMEMCAHIFFCSALCDACTDCNACDCSGCDCSGCDCAGCDCS